MYDAGGDDEIPEGRWTLFALAVRALVNEFMVPVDDDLPMDGAKRQPMHARQRAAGDDGADDPAAAGADVPESSGVE
ncbi:MAG: hypothetical protein EOO67_16635 [Microbacterium sp.]|nr:MAG: hypothetical protein EOO67_16635 [Microbacterium sp.]